MQMLQVQAMLMAQPPSICFWSDIGNSSVAISANSSGYSHDD